MKKFWQKLILKNQKSGRLNNLNKYPIFCGSDTSGGVSNIILKKLVEAGKKKLNHMGKIVLQN